MKIIIDTHIFLWLLEDSNKIKKRYFDILKDKDNNIYLSSVSIAEIMIKKSIGKLEVEFDIVDMLQKMDIETLDYTAQDALKLVDLPLHHKDPFDRMIITQGIINKYKIITQDPMFKYYECDLFV